MADDSMEISSEHGHNDGDIDIDFDFTPAQVDEDYVLEDATLNVDFGEDPHPQPSPAIGNDDLMIDEDIESYPMDDADLLHGEEGHTADPETSQFGNSHYLEDDLNPDLHYEGEVVNSANEYMYAHYQSEVQDVSNEAAKEHSENAPQQEDGLITEVISAPSDENPLADVAPPESQVASPLEGTRKSSASAQLPKKSPSILNVDGGPSSDGQTSGHLETNITSPSLSGDGIKAVEATSLDNSALHTSRAQDVIVVYRSVEYALFSSSELDDPDSFFLSDTAIADKPLAELFKAIRLIIEEELTDEDELCIAVEDLGIETDEVSCTRYVLSHPALMCMQQASTRLYDITLTQIVNLRENLLRNDGVESSRPLCLLLGTRTHFSKRIENLTAGAAEGKGLSQYVNWDEQSESIDDLEKANDDGIVVEPTTDSDDVQKNSGNQDTDVPQPDDVEHDRPEELAHENESEHEPGLEPSEVEAFEHAGLPSASSVSGDAFIQHPSATDDNPSVLQNSNETESLANEIYDQDDLIDYSEEEGESAPEVQRQVKAHSDDESRSKQGTLNLLPPCLKPNTCFCSKCCALLLAEYEAINEDLRRRSLSRTTEDRVSEPSNEQPPSATEDDQGGANAGDNSVQDEKKNEQLGEDQNSNLHVAYDDFTTGEFDAPGSVEQYNGTGLSVDEFGGEGEFTGDSAFGDSFDMFGTEAQEYEYGDQGALEYDDFHHQFQANETEYTGADAVEAKPQQVDTADSSVTVDADEIQYEYEDEVNDEAESEPFDKSKVIGVSHDTQSIPAEQEDEIGYDDEDGVEKEKEPEATTSPSADPTMPSSNGKRSRAETESDDAKSMRGNGTYWPPTAKRQRY